MSKSTRTTLGCIRAPTRASYATAWPALIPTVKPGGTGAAWARAVSLSSPPRPRTRPGPASTRATAPGELFHVLQICRERSSTARAPLSTPAIPSRGARRVRRERVPHPPVPGRLTEGAHRQARVPLAGQRAQDVEIALDPSLLRPRDHHAAADLLHHVHRDLTELHRRAHEGVLSLALQEHVRAEAARIPGAHRGGGHERHARARRIVKGAGRTLEGLPGADGLALEVDHVLVAAPDVHVRRRSSTLRPSHADNESSSSASDPSGSWTAPRPRSTAPRRTAARARAGRSARSPSPRRRSRSGGRPRDRPRRPRPHPAAPPGATSRPDSARAPRPPSQRG